MVSIYAVTAIKFHKESKNPRIPLDEKKPAAVSLLLKILAITENKSKPTDGNPAGVVADAVVVVV